MGFLQNYLGLEPAYKDGYELPLLGMMKWYCIELARPPITVHWPTHAAATGPRANGPQSPR